MAVRLGLWKPTNDEPWLYTFFLNKPRIGLSVRSAIWGGGLPMGCLVFFLKPIASAEPVSQLRQPGLFVFKKQPIGRLCLCAQLSTER